MLKYVYKSNFEVFKNHFKEQTLIIEFLECPIVPLFRFSPTFSTIKIKLFKSKPMKKIYKKKYIKNLYNMYENYRLNS